MTTVRVEEIACYNEAMRPTLPPAILEERIVPVARGLDAISAPVLVSALLAGGISTIEITVEGRSGLGAIEAVAGGPATVGAGTIVTVSDAADAMAAGATFLVSPHTDQALAEWASENGAALIPGALTPTEVAAAWLHRPAALKLFPASLGGPEYLSALLGPFPDLALIPTGGIDGDNAAAFIQAGAVAVGVGAWLTGSGDMDLVTERAARLREVV